MSENCTQFVISMNEYSFLIIHMTPLSLPPTNPTPESTPGETPGGWHLLSQKSGIPIN